MEEPLEFFERSYPVRDKVCYETNNGPFIRWYQGENTILIDGIVDVDDLKQMIQIMSEEE